MKNFLRKLLQSDDVDEETEAERVARRGTRHPLRGQDAGLLVDNVRFAMRLKDISCTGAAGMTDAPIHAGQLVSLELVKDVFRSGEVRWTRVTMAGVQFDEPLSLDLVQKVRDTIVA